MAPALMFRRRSLVRLAFQYYTEPDRRPPVTGVASYGPVPPPIGGDHGAPAGRTVFQIDQVSSEPTSRLPPLAVVATRAATAQLTGWPNVDERLSTLGRRPASNRAIDITVRSGGAARAQSAGMLFTGRRLDIAAGFGSGDSLAPLQPLNLGRRGTTPRPGTCGDRDGHDGDVAIQRARCGAHPVVVRDDDRGALSGRRGAMAADACLCDRLGGRSGRLDWADCGATSSRLTDGTLRGPLPDG